LLKIDISVDGMRAIRDRVKSRPVLSGLLAVVAVVAFTLIAFGHNESRHAILWLLNTGSGFHDLKKPYGIVDFIRESKYDAPAVKTLRQELMKGSPSVANVYPKDHPVEVRSGGQILPRKARVCEASEFYKNEVCLFHIHKDKSETLVVTADSRLKDENCVADPNAIIEIGHSDFRELTRGSENITIAVEAIGFVRSRFLPYVLSKEALPDSGESDENHVSELRNCTA